MSINRNLATFAKDVQTDGSLKGIAVTVTVSGGKYVIDGTSQQTMFIPKGVKYRFDVSDSTNSNHPLRFSTTSDGTHGSGSQYTTGITTSGTAGSAGAYVEVQLQQDAPDLLYYYCGNHSGMGGSAETAPQAVTTYTDSDVNTHLNYSSAASGQVLGYNGSDYAWVDNPSYTNSDVDSHLNRSSASSNQILSWNGSDYAWVDDQSGSGGIASVAADSTPQLGGALDVNGNAIVSASNGNIAITPNGSGKIILDGLSFPTSDGSADQVLKTDGNGQLAFVDQSGGGAAGGSLTATASGALTDGSTVAINADGTVSVIKAAVSQSIGTAARFGTGTATDSNGNEIFAKAAYDTNSNKVVVAYRNVTDSGHGYAVVGTVSGSSISWGTAVEFSNGSACDNIAISFDSSANKMLITYRDYANSYYGYGVVGTVSGTSISFGSATQFEAGLVQYTDSAFDTNTNKHLVVYQDYHDNTYGKAVVATISGTSVSFGSPTTYRSYESQWNTVSYDSNAQKFLIAWQRGTTHCEAVVATISGTSVSFGTVATVASGYYKWQSLAFDSSANKHVIAYENTSSPYNGTAQVGTISGTSVSFGSAAVFDTNIQEGYFAASYNAAANKTIITYNRGSNTGSGYYVIGTISGTSISFGTAAEFENGHVVSGNDVIYDPDSEKNILVFNDNDDYQRGKYIVFTQAIAGGATLTAENYIGISDGAYADGATATIQTAGAVDDAQSGLTAGQTYYVQAATGALGLTPDTISVVAGTAISSTKLLINPDSDPTVTAYTDADVNTHLNVSSASANQVLSWNGSDYAWTNDSTSPSLNATAAGTLANGDMIIVNADGTVSAIGTQSVSASTGSTSVFETSNIVNTSTAYDPVNDKIVVTYTDEGDNDYGKVVVGSLSGSTITFGTPVNFNAAKTSGTQIIYDTNAAKFVILFDTGHSTYNGKAVVGTVSGTTMTFGSAVTFHAASTSSISGYYDPDTQKIVVGYKKNSNSNGVVIVGTVSGTSISFGSENVFDDDARQINLSYDENANKTLIVYSDNDNSLYGTAKVGSISGTSMTFGSATVFETAQMSAPSAVYDPSSQKMVVHYIDSGNSSYGTAIVATISGTSVSFGSAVVFNSGSTSRISAVYNSAAAKIVVSYQDQGNSNYPTIIEGTVSGTTPSYGSEVALASSASNYVSSVYNSSSKSVITSYADTGNSSYGTAIVRISSYNVTRSLTSENFIGVANAAYTDGQTATIQIAGAVDDAQSGLTAGQSYYVQADGSLGTSPDTIAVMAGTALSATELAINPDTNPSSYTNTQVDAHLNVSSASANQKLSWNGSDYAWTDDATGSGSVTATASGALANGDMVVLNSDGTVSVVADSTQAFSAGTPAVAYSSNISGDPTIVYHSAANKLLAVYKDSSSNTTYASLGTVSGTSITFANQVTFESTNSIDYLAAAYDSNAEAVVCCYRKLGSPFYFGAKAMTVSGTTITVGSERNLLSQQVGFCDVVFDSNVNRLVFAALDFDNSYALKAVVGSVSGTTISSGSAQTIHSATYNHQMVFDSGSNKVIVVYRDNANSLYGAARVLDVASGSNTISTIGSATYYNSDRTDNPRVGYDANANKSIVLYTDYNNSEYQTLQVGTVSGTSISFGSKITGFHDLSIAYRDIAYDPDNQNMALFMRRNVGALDDTVYFPVTISGTSATVGSASEILGASDGLESYGRRWVTYDTTANKFALFFKNTDDSQAQGVLVQSPFDGSTNLTDENFLGVSDGAYSSGATATIQTAGAVDDAQSSLTPAQTYFVQSTGGIGLTPSSPSVVAGTAISATKLLIKSGQAVEKPNTTQIVASGALSDGTKVCINSDGTASAIAESSESQTIGSEAVFHTAYAVYPKVAYDANAQKVVVVFRDAGDSSKGKAIVGTISGTSISFGSAATFETGSMNYPNIAYDSNAQKVVIVWGTNTNGKAIVGTVSGTSISFGSAVNWNSNQVDYNGICFDSTANKIVVVGRTTNNGYGVAAVGTVSGTSISFGSAATFNSASTMYTSVSYDTNADKHVIAYRNSGNNHYGTAKVATVSGTSISFGSAVTFNSNQSDYISIAYHPVAQKHVLAYMTASPIQGASIVGTVSGTSISFGSQVIFDSSNAYYETIVYHEAAQKMVLSYHNSSAYGVFRVGTVSGTSISYTSATTFHSANTNDTASAYDANSKRVITVFSDNSNSNYGTSFVYTPAYTDQNLTATNYIGISDAAYTNGQTATIQVAGATDDAQSGLTAGQLYYVQNDGTLSTTADSPSVIAGTAISATKLIVKG